MARVEEMGASPSRTPVNWRRVFATFGVSVIATAVLGGGLFWWGRSVWWIAVGGSLALLAAGFYLGRKAGPGKALEATLLALLYFGTMVVILFAGELVEALPDPLPGIPIGDSTFFFVWPLAQLSASVVGALLGGWRRPGGQARAEG